MLIGILWSKGHEVYRKYSFAASVSGMEKMETSL